MGGLEIKRNIGPIGHDEVINKFLLNLNLKSFKFLTANGNAPPFLFDNGAL